MGRPRKGFLLKKADRTRALGMDKGGPRTKKRSVQGGKFAGGNAKKKVGETKCMLKILYVEKKRKTEQGIGPPCQAFFKRGPMRLSVLAGG